MSNRTRMNAPASLPWPSQTERPGARF